MHLCRVVGTVVATRKQKRLRLARLLLSHRVGLDGAPLPAADR